MADNIRIMVNLPDVVGYLSALSSYLGMQILLKKVDIQMKV